MTTASAAPTRRLGFGSRLSRWDLRLSPYLYISPFFLLFLVVGLFPIAYTAVISFMDWDQVRGSGQDETEPQADDRKPPGRPAER